MAWGLALGAGLSLLGAVKGSKKSKVKSPASLKDMEFVGRQYGDLAGKFKGHMQGVYDAAKRDRSGLYKGRLSADMEQSIRGKDGYNVAANKGQLAGLVKLRDAETNARGAVINEGNMRGKMEKLENVNVANTMGLGQQAQSTASHAKLANRQAGDAVQSAVRKFDRNQMVAGAFGSLGGAALSYGANSMGDKIDAYNQQSWEANKANYKDYHEFLRSPDAYQTQGWQRVFGALGGRQV